MTSHLKEHLEQRYTYDQKFKKTSVISDGAYLDKAISSFPSDESQRILCFFCGSNSYRLRYQKHIDLSIAYIKHVLEKCDLLSSNATLWGIRDVKSVASKYATFFSSFHKKITETSPNKIYRLFDLYSNLANGAIFKGLNITAFQSKHFMSLMYAFGAGQNNKPIETVDELAAKCQFFEAVYDALFDIHRGNGANKLDAARKTDEDLSSMKGLTILNQYWDAYQDVASDLLTIDSQPLYQQLLTQCSLNTGASETIKITEATRSRLRTYTGQIAEHAHFPSVVSAAYHIFKHLPEAEMYFNENRNSLQFKQNADKSGIAYEKDRYMKMITEILSKQTLKEIRPDQFDVGIALTFEELKEINSLKKTLFRVHAKITPRGSTFLLTCF